MSVFVMLISQRKMCPSGTGRNIYGGTIYISKDDLFIIYS